MDQLRTSKRYFFKRRNLLPSIPPSCNERINEGWALIANFMKSVSTPPCERFHSTLLLGTNVGSSNDEFAWQRNGLLMRSFVGKLSFPKPDSFKVNYPSH